MRSYLSMLPLSRPGVPEALFTIEQRLPGRVKVSCHLAMTSLPNGPAPWIEVSAAGGVLIVAMLFAMWARQPPSGCARYRRRRDAWS